MRYFLFTISLELINRTTIRHTLYMGGMAFPPAGKILGAALKLLDINKSKVLVFTLDFMYEFKSEEDYNNFVKEPYKLGVN